MAEKKQAWRYATESRSGQTVFLPQSELTAFRKGQERLQAGETPSGLKQRSSAILSKMQELGSKAQAN